NPPWPPLRAPRAFARTCLAGYRTGTRARRTPTLLSRHDGSYKMRYAARQYPPSWAQPPPRITRDEPLRPTRSAHHCCTLPCMSYNPNLLGGYAPTRVGRPRYFPFGALPNGKGPLKLAWSEDRSLVGLAR